MGENSEEINLFVCDCGQPSIMNNFFTNFKSVVTPSPKNSKCNNFTEDYFHLNRTPLQAMIKEEFLHYCYNSTIRGVPRIAKSRNKPMLILWTISFFCLLMGFGACLCLLWRQFMDYNVIHPPRVLTDYDADFPAITLCNARPLSSEGKLKIEQNNWRKPNEYSSVINYWAIQEFFRKDRKTDYNLATYAMQLSSYLESLPAEEDRMSLGHKLEKFVIYCQITYLDGSKAIARPCKDTGNWTEYIHAFYINCATYNLFKEFRKTAKIIEMYLFLEEDMNEINCHDCNKYDIKSQLSGAVLGIDRPETISNINEKSIILMPGTLTEIRLKTFENIQITPPYGRCSRVTPTTLRMFNRDMVYSEFGCKQATIQTDIARLCKCVTIEYPYNISSLPFCVSLSAFLYKDQCEIKSNGVINETCINILEKSIKNIQCKEIVKRKYYRDNIENCTIPCSFLSYESDRSTSKWPTKSYQLTLLDNKVFRDKDLINKTVFEPYQKIKNHVKKGEIKEAAKLLDQTNILERNLLAILISKPNFNVHKVEEKEVLSLTSFLSQIGGLCSIWIGLTMISIVEILELVLQLGSIFCVARKSNDSKQFKENSANKWSLNISNKKYVKDLNSNLSDELLPKDEIRNENAPRFYKVSTLNKGMLKCQKCNEETIF